MPHVVVKLWQTLACFRQQFGYEVVEVTEFLLQRRRQIRSMRPRAI